MNGAMYGGICIMAVARTIEIVTQGYRYDMAFWLYFFGGISFCSSMSFENFIKKSDRTTLINGVFGVALVAGSIYTERIQLAIYGVIAVFAIFGTDVFDFTRKVSLFFSLLKGIVGLLFLGLSVKYESWICGLCFLAVFSNVHGGMIKRIPMGSEILNYTYFWISMLILVCNNAFEGFTRLLVVLVGYAGIFVFHGKRVSFCNHESSSCLKKEAFCLQ